MKIMKHLIPFLFVVFGFFSAQADDAIAVADRAPAAAVVPVSDTIIDPELMNKGVWAEPYFRGPGETPRDTASSDDPNKKQEKEPEQYLDVLTEIPSSEPTLSRAWVEHKALSED
jgi:hypothetical protein